MHSSCDIEPPSTSHAICGPPGIRSHPGKEVSPGRGSTSRPDPTDRGVWCAQARQPVVPAMSVTDVRVRRSVRYGGRDRSCEDVDDLHDVGAASACRPVKQVQRVDRGIVVEVQVDEAAVRECLPAQVAG